MLPAIHLVGVAEKDQRRHCVVSLVNGGEAGSLCGMFLHLVSAAEPVQHLHPAGLRAEAGYLGKWLPAGHIAGGIVQPQIGGALQSRQAVLILVDVRFLWYRADA